MPAEERRRAILAAARAEFAAHGFHAAGTAAIARAAGCSEAILYRHFASKKDLLLAVLRAEVEGRLASGRAMAPAEGADPARALPDVLRARLQEGEMEITARLIMLGISLVGDPEVGREVGGLFAAVRAPLRAALEAGQRAGSVRDDIDPELLTWMWHGLFLVAAARDAIARDGGALEAIDAARALARMTAPPEGPAS